MTLMKYNYNIYLYYFNIISMAICILKNQRDLTVMK